MRYKRNCLELIGNTPLIRLSKIEKEFNLPFSLFAKLEKYNSSGSIKDRPSLFMIQDALNKKIINNDTLIIEATSGNTGISLSMICAYYDLKLHIYMPESSSIERVKIMKAYGAEVILTPKEEGMNGSLKAALKEHQENNNSFIPSQFENTNNILSHYQMTAKEILYDLKYDVDVIIAGIGTSGTIMGIAKCFKDKKMKTKIIGVEPMSSPLISMQKKGIHKIQGIGPNFISPLFDKTLIDEIILIRDEEAYNFCSLLAKKEGLLCGISSGASLAAVSKLNYNDYKNKNVVIILPDGGERYLSIDGLYENSR